MLMDHKVLASGVRTDSVEGGKPGKLGTGDGRRLGLQRPDDRCGLALRRKLVTAPCEFRCGSVCRRQANRVGTQTQCLAELAPERDVRLLLGDVTCELGGVSAADLLEPNRAAANYVRLLPGVLAELIAR